MSRARLVEKPTWIKVTCPSCSPANVFLEQINGIGHVVRSAMVQFADLAHEQAVFRSFAIVHNAHWNGATTVVFVNQLHVFSGPGIVLADGHRQQL